MLRSFSRNLFSRFASPAVLVAVGSMALQDGALCQGLGTKLNEGDIVYADSGNSIDGGFIIKVNPNTRQKTVVASGGYLQLPFDVAVDPAGQIIVSDSERLIRINPETGDQQIIADNSRGLLGFPFGIGMEPSGIILVEVAI
jgi:DNA-binding beta-propeller fold protein YncE